MVSWELQELIPPSVPTHSPTVASIIHSSIPKQLPSVRTNSDAGLLAELAEVALVVLQPALTADKQVPLKGPTTRMLCKVYGTHHVYKNLYLRATVYTWIYLVKGLDVL